MVLNMPGFFEYASGSQYLMILNLPGLHINIYANMPKSAKMVFVLHAPIVIPNCQTEGVVT